MDILSLVHDFKSMGLEWKLESPEHCRDVAEPPDGGLSVCIDEDHACGRIVDAGNSKSELFLSITI